MKYLVAVLALVAVVLAEEYQSNGRHLEYGFPVLYASEYRPRYRRDVTFDHKVGQNGKVFGTLGQNDNGLFGKGGYQHNVFNDHRGKLDANAYGSRVLGPYGDSSHVGGGLNWQNSNAKASLDVSRQIHGHSSINAAAGGHWPVGKNGDLSAQGFYNRGGGIKDYGGMANFGYRF